MNCFPRTTLLSAVVIAAGACAEQSAVDSEKDKAPATSQPNAREDLDQLLAKSEAGAPRYTAIVEYLSHSGAASTQFRETGQRFRTVLEREGLIHGDAGCYQAGCYYQLAATEIEKIVAVRNVSAPGHQLT